MAIHIGLVASIINQGACEQVCGASLGILPRCSYVKDLGCLRVPEDPTETRDNWRD